ncbi:hypothetical protein [Actinoplanes sp. DH11]|uniref:hypothetical protein n=1 Tax=Actinoplanes sp. DH11 TaxID=2857011 RepID=UPI001E5E682D|nr:hypothetical protein [Actinoplanes sp. DH11]
MNQGKPEPNSLLMQARRWRPSPSGSGRPMSRQELAEAINLYLWQHHQIVHQWDETDIGRLERGENRWPGRRRREAFRAVLQVAADHEIGFYIRRSSTATSAHGQATGKVHEELDATKRQLKEASIAIDRYLTAFERGTFDDQDPRRQSPPGRSTQTDQTTPSRQGSPRIRARPNPRPAPLPKNSRCSEARSPRSSDRAGTGPGRHSSKP